ncbi:hypothetical protein [Spiroplasma cantharicola]|uniref:hypothetical protein n=1 Tax=Spiroplasma cantharicola TaxID=362837 RepID=UPI001F2B5CC6|nr:hypothetical protein [Spiroplasma cantharicola]
MINLKNEFIDASSTAILILSNLFNYLFIGIFSIILTSTLFKSSTTLNILNMEQRHGINKNIMFFTRILFILAFLYLLIIINLITSLFFLIGNEDTNRTYYYYVIKPYLILLFITIFYVSFSVLIFSYFKKNSASIINSFLVFILSFSGLFNYIGKQIISSSPVDDVKRMSEVNVKINMGYEFYEQYKNDEYFKDIFIAPNFAKNIWNASGEQKINLATFFHEYGNTLDPETARFYKMGQILNVKSDETTEEILQDDLIINDGNKILGSFAFDTYEVLKDWKSPYNLEMMPMNIKNSNKINFDTKYFIKELKKDNKYWNKYSDLILFLNKRKLFFFQYGRYMNLYFKNNIGSDFGEWESSNKTEKQLKVNEFYKNAPEYLLFSQMLFTYWAYSMKIPLNSNKIYTENYFGESFTFENYNKIFIKNNVESFLNIFTFNSFLNEVNIDNNFNSDYISNIGPMNNYKTLKSRFDLKNVKEDIDRVQNDETSQLSTDSSIFDQGIKPKEKGIFLIIYIYLFYIILDVIFIFFANRKFKKNIYS